ncbi:MAG: hypothetical protein CME62_04260 [Halobacteriovoraceae bacterium]|nr:hypothetical protein [Halobacteriovoraceae bacterium]
MKKTLTLAISLTLTQAAFSSDKSEQIIYGVDNRIETYQASYTQKKLAHSTAGMVETVKLVKTKDKVMLPPISIKKEMGLCEDEKFSDQPSSVICSGFLVGPNLLVTAGHCVPNQARCNEVSFVFDYKIEADSRKADMLVSKNKVFKCNKVIEAKLQGRGNSARDYALIKLDRVVPGRSALKIRSKSKIADNSNLLVIGHPSGLPQKIASGARVFSNTSPYFFKTNLDTFGGNSGSAVFNTKTLEVEGILVRGAKDYVADSINRCIRVNNETEDIKDRFDLGESVSRITEIYSLKNRDKLFKAIKENDLNYLDEYMTQGSLAITDDQLNTVLHIASATGHMQMLEKLISLGADLNAQNEKGETPVHIAAFHNKKDVIKALVAKGADLNIADKAGMKAISHISDLDIDLVTLLGEVNKL